MRKFTKKLVATLAIAGLGWVSGAAQAQMAVTSPAFANGATIPNPFAYSLGAQCSGSNWTPPLDIANIPAGTQSLAITVVDPSAGNFLHWKAWGHTVSGTTLTLPYNTAASWPGQAQNDFGSAGYGGPCPPDAGNHNYVFTVYALTTTPATQAEAEAAMNVAPADHQATLTGVRNNASNTPWSPSAPVGSVQSVPTLSEWGLVLMGLLVAGGAVVSLRRRLDGRY